MLPPPSQGAARKCHLSLSGPVSVPTGEDTMVGRAGPCPPRDIHKHQEVMVCGLGEQMGWGVMPSPRWRGPGKLQERDTKEK